MGFKLKKLFKKKPGGTLFGNALRGVAKLASKSGLVPGAGLVSKLLPAAPPFQKELAQDLISQAVKLPALLPEQIKEVASQAKLTFLDAGGSKEEASAIGAATFAAASLPPAQAVAALENAADKVSSVAPQGVGMNNFTAADVKTVINGAIAGARDGATGAYLNETETGKAQKRGAINAEGAKIMPWLLGILAGIIVILLVKKN